MGGARASVPGPEKTEKTTGSKPQDRIEEKLQMNSCTDSGGGTLRTRGLFHATATCSK